MGGGRHRSSWWGSSALVAMALAACVTLRPPSGEPLLEALEVDEVMVEAIAAGDASPAGREWFRALLAAQASASARGTAFEYRLAAIIRRAPGGTLTSHRLAGRVSVPVALPSELRGSRAAFTKGDLATARVELLDGRGGVLAAAESRVGWGEVRWTIGGPKTKHARDPDLALVEAAELAVERAVRRLIADMRSRAAAARS